MRDLRFLEKIVANARDGALLNHGWAAIEHSDKPMTFEFSAGRSWPASLEAKERHTPILRPCKDKACIESYHDDGKAKEQWHVAEAFSGASWEVETFRVGKAPWSVFIDCRTDKLSHLEAMAISKALSVAAAAVERLNRESVAHA